MRQRMLFLKNIITVALGKGDKIMNRKLKMISLIFAGILLFIAGVVVGAVGTTTVSQGSTSFDGTFIYDEYYE